MSCRGSAPGEALSLTQAVALGILQGPTELLPVSSSAHITIVPWLLGSSYVQLDDELRKSFEVALHAGTAAALALALRGEVHEAVADLDRRTIGLLAASFLPPAIVGYTLERAIERRLGRPETIAFGLAIGALAMALADRSPQRRQHSEAGLVDGLWLGVAQACSLMPGVSRNGATLAAARFRGFTRVDANRLSRHAALPVIAGATILKSVRLYGRGVAPGTALPLALGAGAAFASTLASRWLIGQVERNRSLAPYAAYRLGLAGVVVARLRAGRLRD
jgi:undecaprenyl-diphosphatase